MSFTRETLSDFLSKIFVIGIGDNLKKSLDEGGMMDNFEKWIIEQKDELTRNKKSISDAIIHFRIILLPIICGDGDDIGLQDYIKERVIQNYPAEINSGNLNQFVEEASISAARKIYNFFEILAQVLELDPDSNSNYSDSEWEDDLLEETSLLKHKANREKMDFNSVLKEVFYKETEHYIFHHLKNYVPPRVCTPRPERAQASPLEKPQYVKSRQSLPRPHALFSDDEGELRIELVPAFETRKALIEPLVNTEDLEVQQERRGLKWRFLITASIFVGSFFSPLSLVVGYALWDLLKNKKKHKRAENSTEVKLELFKARKPRSQHLIRPRELLSDEEAPPSSRV